MERSNRFTSENSITKSFSNNPFIQGDRKKSTEKSPKRGTKSLKSYGNVSSWKRTTDRKINKNRENVIQSTQNLSSYDDLKKQLNFNYSQNSNSFSKNKCENDTTRKRGVSSQNKPSFELPPRSGEKKRNNKIEISISPQRTIPERKRLATVNKIQPNDVSIETKEEPRVKREIRSLPMGYQRKKISMYDIGEKDKTKPRAVPKSQSRPPRDIVRDKEKLKIFYHQESKKDDLIDELIKTEEEYVENLNVVIKYYIKPCRATNILSPRLFSKCFLNFNSIVPINELFLKKLRTVKKNGESYWVGDKLVCNYDRKKFYKIVQEFSQCFKLYIQYITKFSELVSLLKSERKNNEKFGLLLKDNRDYFRKNGFRIQELHSYLILPVQRIPRYEMLIKSILKEHQKVTVRNKTQADELEDLKRSLELIQGIAKYCDQRQAEFALDYKIHEIEKLLNVKGLIEPSRHLIKEEKKVDTMFFDGKKFPCDLYLFSDILILHKKKKGIFKKKGETIILNLSEGVFQKLSGKGFVCKFYEKSRPEETTVIFFFEMKSVMTSWLDSIDKQMDLVSNRVIKEDVPNGGVSIKSGIIGSKTEFNSSKDSSDDFGSLYDLDRFRRTANIPDDY